MARKPSRQDDDNSALDDQLRGTIGVTIRLARKGRGLTQEDVAELLGISAEFYARIERGHALPSVPTFHKIIRALDVSADTALGLMASANASNSQAGRKAEYDIPEIRRIMRRLRDSSAGQVRLVTLLVKELERTFVGESEEDQPQP